MPPPVTYRPTAAQAEVDAHDTPASALYVMPLGLTADFMAQDVPFHASASVRSVEVLGGPFRP